MVRAWRFVFLLKYDTVGSEKGLFRWPVEKGEKKWNELNQQSFKY
mgnify:CR=1 FL=1